MFDLNSNVLFKSGLTAAQLDEAVSKIRPDQLLQGMFQAAVDAEKKYNLSSIFIVAHAITETGYGHSMFAQTRNNLFGFNAIDSDPGQASRYPSKSSSVEYYAAFLNEHYLHEGGQYYNGATPHGIMVRYASAGDQAAKTIAQVMSMIAKNAGYVGAPVPDGFPTETVATPEEDVTIAEDIAVTPEQPPVVEEPKIDETPKQNNPKPDVTPPKSAPRKRSKQQ